MNPRPTAVRDEREHDRPGSAAAEPSSICQICGTRRRPEDSILCRVCAEPVLLWGWAP
jgi:hypothetical protein